MGSFFKIYKQGKNHTPLVNNIAISTHVLNYTQTHCTYQDSWPAMMTSMPQCFTPANHLNSQSILVLDVQVHCQPRNFPNEGLTQSQLVIFTHLFGVQTFLVIILPHRVAPNRAGLKKLLINPESLTFFYFDFFLFSFLIFSFLFFVK